MPRFAANLGMLFTEVPFIERFGAARRAGFEAVEFPLDYDHAVESLAEQLAMHQLEVALINMRPGRAPGDRGLAALSGREMEFKEEIDATMRCIEVLKPTNVHVMSGNAPPKNAAARDVYVSNLRYAAQRFADRPVELVIEPINARDIPGYFMNDFDAAAEVIAAVDRPNLGLQFDIYHRQVTRGDIFKGLEAMLPIIRHVQIAAAPDRHEPGTGELDDAAILSHLDAIGYDGFVGCEYRPAGRTEDGLGWMTALARTRA